SGVFPAGTSLVAEGSPTSAMSLWSIDAKRPSGEFRFRSSLERRERDDEDERPDRGSEEGDRLRLDAERLRRARGEDQADRALGIDERHEGRERIRRQREDGDAAEERLERDELRHRVLREREPERREHRPERQEQEPEGEDGR